MEVFFFKPQLIFLAMVLTRVAHGACPTGCSTCYPDPPDILCTSCNAGYAYYGVYDVCYPCGVSCASCTYRGNTGISACAACQAGYYRDPSPPYRDCLLCQTCNTGMFISRACDFYGNSICEWCPQGNLVLPRLDGTSYCSPCQTGVTYANRDLTACLPCTVCTAPAQYRVNGGQCVTYRDTVCSDCANFKASSQNNLEVCDTCVPGYFRVVSGNSFVCQSCVSVPCSINFYIQCANAARQCTLCDGNTLANACGAGYEPSKDCDGTSTTASVCQVCQKGTERLTNGHPLKCSRCNSLGFYKDRDGSYPCEACSNKPSDNSVYLSWGNTMPDNAECPWGCNAGFYKILASGGSPNQCGSCIATRGTYNNNTLGTTCLLCTNRPALNSYYLLPSGTGFNGGSNNCPWDCNAGYIKSSSGTACVLCSAGSTYRTAASNVNVEGPGNVCLPCRECVNGTNYQTSACTVTSNRVCTACRTSCAKNNYKSSPCITTRDLQCSACRTACNAGYYKSGATCTGNAVFDELLASCKPCFTPSDCGAGKYVSATCPGTGTTSNQCVQCSAIPVSGDCNVNQYRGGCANYTNTRCLSYTTCAANFYLAGESRTQDGVCQRCTNCTALGLSFLRPCSTLLDAVCRAGSCNRSVSCVTPPTLANRSTMFCDYSQGESKAFCGVCPSGYWSDGQFCKECPRGYTCNRLGQVECKGQCGPGTVSVCQAGASAYASCDELCPISVAGTGGRWVRRGTHVRPETCETYFQCGAGYYKIFRSTGVVECEACPAANLPSLTLARWTTEGLSAGDQASCLWECKVELAKLNGPRTGCDILPKRSTVTGINAAGTWLDPLTRLSGDCPGGKTSEAGSAINVSECISCHALPGNAEWLANSRQCEWRCILSGGDDLAQRGGACIAPKLACLGVDGYVHGAGGECTPTSFPWNRAGYAKVSWGIPVVGGLNNLNGVRVSSALQDGLNQTSLGYGVSSRHSLSVEGKAGSWYIEGPLCSACRTQIGKYEFVIGTACNQSFLVYLNLSKATGGLGVLIGNSTPGWRDGFKSQALFESELYVVAGSNGTVYVLDRWNCLLREVVVYGEPGGYLTRVYTVWGNKDKLGLPVPEPKCYGTGALASPRRFWSLRGGWVAFADDNGLWQFHTGTRELIAMVKESDGLFEADDVLDVDATDEYTLRLVFVSGTVWYVSAEEAPCPNDFTSARGGDCVVSCPWLSPSFVPDKYVNRTTGQCTPCAQKDCGYGEVFTLCTRELNGYCQKCEPRVDEANGVYMTPGTCEDTAWRRDRPPCSPGDYAAGDGMYCEACPEFTSTWYAGATDVRQCKCAEGLVRRGARCVGEYLYEYEVACAAREACQVPPNARLVEGDLVGCRFECRAGYYHRTAVGWVDSCGACFSQDANPVPTSRGDDDEPWSCEWV